jgi:hypothetical protein
VDFVERCFAISPDGGTGVFEASLILAVLMVCCIWVFRDKLSAKSFRPINKVALPK